MTAREPSSPYEARIDFSRVTRDTEFVEQRLLRILRRILKDQETATLKWVRVNLAQKKLRTAIAKFELPLQGRYRSALRRWLQSAARAGVISVADEVGGDAPSMAVRDLTRVRARADALADEHRSVLTSSLQRAWSSAMFGKVDADQLEYVTRLAFAEFAGWKVPDGPGA